MSIRKLRAGRVPNVTANNWVGEYGTLFYDEATGQFKIADGVTPGGRYVALVIATPTTAGAIKAGPGANVSSDGTLTINTAGLPLSFGDFSAIGANLSTVNANENMQLVTNGNASINLIGNVKVFATTGNSYPNSPFFNIKQDGQIKIYVTDVDIANGAVEIIGTTSTQSYPALNAGVMLHITGQNSQASRLYNDGVNSFAAFVGRRINNLISSPQAVVAGNDIIRISATGYNGTTIPTTASSRITFFATENWTSSNFGGNIAFSAVNNGTTTLTEVANISVANGLTASKFNTTGNISTTGNLLVSGTTNVLGNLHIASNTTTGSGFNKSGGTVTANGTNGQLTSLADNIGKGSAVTFTVNNNFVNPKDVIIVNIASGGTVASYDVCVTAVNTGSFQVTVTNNGSGPLAEALVFNFAVIKLDA